MKTLKNFGTGKVLTSLLVICLFSLVTLMTSCTATVRTPRHVRSTVVISGQTHSPYEIRQERRNERRMHRGIIIRHD
jgi:hypothetical protein